MGQRIGLVISLAAVIAVGAIVFRRSLGQSESQPIRAGRGEPAVQRWEYEVVDLASVALKADGNTSITDSVEAEFNALGDNGWVLVNMTQGAAAFKRPK